MKVRRLATYCGYSLLGVLVVVGLSPQPLTAQHHAASHGRDQAGALVKIVRESTERFRDVRVAPSSVRKPQSLRTAELLHAARLGMEGQSHRHVRELALQGVVRGVQRAGLRS